MADLVERTPRDAPLLVSIPHAGTFVPEGIGERFVGPARELPDTDWFVDRLYAPLVEELGATVVQARFHRYVVDANRPPSDQSLYPGQETTFLVPTRTFAGELIYSDWDVPRAAERASRRATYWTPYHDALAEELDRLQGIHGRVLLWDAHSIRSRIPRLFDGTLPILNVGTAGGASCSSAIRGAVGDAASRGDVDHVLDGRFRGGFITRHYGQPAHGVHAVQLELAQRSYMDEDTRLFDDAAADAIRPVLRRLMDVALAALAENA